MKAKVGKQARLRFRDINSLVLSQGGGGSGSESCAQ